MGPGMSNKTTPRGTALRLRLASALVVTSICVALCANTAPVPSPADQYGALFSDVQENKIFEDGKTFVDAVPRTDPATIMRKFEAAKPTTPQELRAFVLAEFIVPGINDTAPTEMRAHIKALWPQLVRRDAQTPRAGDSAIHLEQPYVVPGGRFREMYYWVGGRLYDGVRQGSTE